MAVRKNKGGLLKRPKTITEKKFSPNSLKPQQARALIRRYHVLQKNKHAIIRKLQATKSRVLSEVNIENYKAIIKDVKNLEKVFQESFDKFDLSSVKNNSTFVKVDDSLSTTQLVQLLAEIDSEIAARGGIEAYQSASTQGQTAKRGGDSSKRLVEWLKTEEYKSRLNQNSALEIGCLSPNNLISTCGIFDSIVRIDLNSQSPLILEQNFMERPLPRNNSEKFNLISCSLVINFVPSPKERGDMLLRITKFLREPTKDTLSSLFLVLPLPCISNSRYFDNEILQKIMASLGFKQVFYYEAKKVAYWLFDWQGKRHQKLQVFTKKEAYSGSKRNNFCITLEAK
ncbi:hypothetical protein G9P44_002099 [Scheffersomyces stipitis]|nr:hypothetical protein G9P44_002099 [Scheffersomyces stipitis]